MNKQVTPFLLTVYHSGECGNAKRVEQSIHSTLHEYSDDNA